jgi:hypothetical protein
MRRPAPESSVLVTSRLAISHCRRLSYQYDVYRRQSRKRTQVMPLHTALTDEVLVSAAVHQQPCSTTNGPPTSSVGVALLSLLINALGFVCLVPRRLQRGPETNLPCVDVGSAVGAGAVASCCARGEAAKTAAVSCCTRVAVEGNGDGSDPGVR